jgi:hypothetical protein
MSASQKEFYSIEIVLLELAVELKDSSVGTSNRIKSSSV